MNTHVLLLGNGVNNLTNVYTWRNLIEDLISFSGAEGTVRVAAKPFPLLYEEIYLNAVRNRGVKELELKAFIAEKVLALHPNEIHARIMAMGLTDILTTNYEYTLEAAVGADTKKGLKNKGLVTETTYSLFRYVEAGTSRIWHIHGECNRPQTINLGYEQYSGYLQQMRNYMVRGTGDAYRTVFEPLVKRLAAGEIDNDSWVDFFLTRDIYILGLTLDFIEIHLWWLLTYRARRKFKEAKVVDNRIVYFYPSHYRPMIQDKLDLLAATEVVAVPLEMSAEHPTEFYLAALEQVRAVP
jgi:hypothetical protein